MTKKTDPAPTTQIGRSLSVLFLATPFLPLAEVRMSAIPDFTELTINGKTIEVNAPSDVAVAQRVAGHLQRRIEEDDGRPYKNKEEAVAAWSKLGGIRAKVMDALGLT